MKKKFIIIILTFSPFVVTAQLPVTLTLDCPLNVEIGSGNHQISINMENAETVLEFELLFNFPSPIIDINDVLPGNLIDPDSIEWNSQGSDFYLLQWESLDGEGIAPGIGSLADIIFYPNYLSDEVNLSITDAHFFDLNGNELQVDYSGTCAFPILQPEDLCTGCNHIMMPPFFCELLSEVQDYSSCDEGDLLFVQEFAGQNGLDDHTDLGFQVWENGRLTGFYAWVFLAGELPESIGNLTAIRSIDLFQTNVSGHIPESIGDCDSLRVLSLMSNNFDGEVPSSIGNLSFLTSLKLAGNQFSGHIPQSIGNLINLHSLYLQNNNLYGPLPDSIGNLTHLRTMRIFDNLFSGSIPETIGNMTNLREIQASGCAFSGNMPTTIVNLDSLELLYLSNNQLSGSIPESIGDLASIHAINLENNQIKGTIPVSVGNLATLTTFRVQNNRLSGVIPNSICDLNVGWNLDYQFSISDNRLCPPYPECIDDIIGVQDTLLCELNCGQPGDINFDQSLDVLDITSVIINCIFTWNDNVCYCADMNDDGLLNVIDIILIVGIIIG